MFLFSKSILRSVGEIFEGVLEVLIFFYRVKVGCPWIIKGVEHALIFKALFPGCQNGVDERVSLRGVVLSGALLELTVNHPKSAAFFLKTATEPNEPNNSKT